MPLLVGVFRYVEKTVPTLNPGRPIHNASADNPYYRGGPVVFWARGLV